MASLIGKEIGKYRITERLGQGGMAEVYAGVHTHLDRKVAVKVLHSYLLEGGDFVARFKREAKAVANLRHPNIVQVYDFDIQDDLIFMVMEYIDGVNLHSKLVEVANKGERMPIKLIGSVINDIASALDYAHSKGMLHRDIKPSNIMIDTDDKAYLTDFGIAKLVSDQKFTATGTLVGTPAYMSPEQGMGDDVSKESDIYSLGVVAFEMLTGQVPYDAKTPIGIVHKQINDPVPTMSELVDGVPGSAQDVIDRALAKTPEGRYSSAEDLVGALRTALSALEATDRIAIPVEEPPTVVDDGLDAPTVAMDAEEMEQPTVVMEDGTSSKEEKPKKEAKPKPAKQPGEKKPIPLWAYIAGGVGLLAVAAVIITQVLGVGLPGSSSGYMSDDPNAIEVFIRPDQQENGLIIRDDIGDGNFRVVDLSSGESGFQTGLEGDDLYLYFDADDSMIHELPEGSEVVVILTYLDQGTDGISIEYDAHSGGNSGDGRFRGAGVLYKTDTGEISTAEFSLQDAYFGNRIHGVDIRIFDVGDGHDVILGVNVIYIPQAGQQVDQAESYSEEGEALFNQAFASFEAGDDPAAIDLCYQAIDAGYESAEVFNLIGRSYRRMGDYEAALDPYNIALELDPDHFWAHYGRGMVRLSLDDLYGGIEDLQAASELDSSRWAVWHYLGEAYYFTGEDDLKGFAHQAFDNAIEIDPSRYESFQLRGEVKWFRFGDFETAIEDLTIAIDLNPDEASVWNVRGLVYWETEQWDLCISDYNEALARSQENPWLYKERGDCYLGIGDQAAARADYEEAIRVAEEQIALGNQDFGGLVNDLQSWLDQNP